MTVTTEHLPPAGPGRASGGRGRAVFRRLIAGDGPAGPGRAGGPGIGLSGLIPNPWARAVVCLAGLALSLWGSVTTLHPGFSGRGTVVLVSVTVAGLGWLAWVAAKGGPVLPTALVAMGAAGGAAATAGSAGLIFVGVAAAGAAAAFDLPAAVVLAASGPVAFVVAAAAQGMFPGRLLAVATTCLVGLVSATGRRQMVQRARQAALIATASQRAEVVRREAELVGERNRLGRELHDVLAHTLGALSIQLTALDTLVATGASREALRGEIERSHRLVGEGLDEARQAVRALREDSMPLAGQLERLCGQHGAGFEVAGTPRPVRAEVSLALYRVAQEALTNAAKHAPGAAVGVRFGFGSGAVTLAVRNDVPGSGARNRLGAAGGGYGLQGMRERVLLAGGRCQAGPVDGGWQVTARIPA